jgi:hypothetical protein
VRLIEVDAEPLQLTLHLVVLQTDLNQAGAVIAPFDDTLVVDIVQHSNPAGGATVINRQKEGPV